MGRPHRKYLSDGEWSAFRERVYDALAELGPSTYHALYQHCGQLGVTALWAAINELTALGWIESRVHTHPQSGGLARFYSVAMTSQGSGDGGQGMGIGKKNDRSPLPSTNPLPPSPDPRSGAKR